MRYFLRQVVPPGHSALPIQIDLVGDETHVGKLTCLRLQNCDFVSRKHAVFYKADDGTVLVRDVGSRNGLFVNGVRVGNCLKHLKVGDRIGFGTLSENGNGFLCVFCSESDPEVVDLTEEDAGGMPDATAGNSRTPSCVSGSPFQKNVILNASSSSAAHLDLRITSGRKLPECIRTRNCVVRLVRCDSEDFVWPPDVRRTFLERIVSKPRKLSRQLSSDSSEESCVGISSSSRLSRRSEVLESRNVNRHKKRRAKILSSDCSSEEEAVPNSSHSRRCRVLKQIDNNKAFSGHRKKRSKVLSPDSSEGSQKEVVSKSSFSQQNTSVRQSKNKKAGLNPPKKHAKVLSSDSTDENIPNELPAAVTCKDEKSAVREMGNEPPAVKVEKFSRGLGSDSSEENSKDACSNSSPGATKKSFKKELENEPSDRIQHIPDVTSTNPHTGKEEIIDSLKTAQAIISSYSVNEECIFISDDEAYLNAGSPFNYSAVKQEPEEIDDFDDEDIFKEIFGSNSVDCNDYVTTFNGSQNEEIESIDSIRAFVGLTDELHSTKPDDPPSSPGSNSALRYAEVSPVAPRDSGNETELSDENYILKNSVNLSVGNGLPPAENCTPKIMTIKDNIISKNKSNSRTLFTEPKPMMSRHRACRKRGEDIVERGKDPIPTSSPTKRKEYLIPTLSPAKTKKNTISTLSPTERRKRNHPIPLVSPTDRQEQRERQLQGNQESRVQNPKALTASQTCIYNNVSRYKVDNVGSVGFSRTKSYAVTPPERNLMLKGLNSCSQPGDENRQTGSTNTVKHSYNAEKLSQETTGKTAVAHVRNLASCSAAHTTEAVQRYSKQTLGNSSGSNFKPEMTLRISTDSARYSDVKTYELSSFGVVKFILIFNTIWLKEQDKITVPPPLVVEGARKLSLSFTSYESYVEYFYPMMKLEIWSCMHMESKQNKIFFFSPLPCTTKTDYNVLECESVIENGGFQPREGMLVKLELKEVSNKCNVLFGFILRHEVKPLNSYSRMVPGWERLMGSFRSDASLWTYSVRIKQKDFSYDMGRIMKGYGICYLKNKVRLADALFCLRESPLMKDILKPKLSTFTLKCIPSQGNRLYSDRQMEIIEGISAEISKPLKPKITLLQGYPGSGKTQIVIGIIETLFCGDAPNPDIKVLVTAQSNGALDEIGIRLAELNERMRRRRVKFVRVGHEKRVHEKVMPYLIEKQARDLYHVHRRKIPMDRHTELRYQEQVLRESQVVLSTLSSCGLSLLRRTFNPRSDVRFSCCIVDDSTQSTELHLLESLMSGVSKLVLTGDFKAMPATVHSKYAKDCNLGRSMLERFHDYFKDICKTASPVVTLTEQFRMHSAICKFPSEHVYENGLLTHPALDDRYRDFPLPPYFVMDILKPGGGLSSAEGIVCEVVRSVSECSPHSTAVIVPGGSGQLTRVAGSLCSRHAHVEVGAVSQFQGREFDATILCALREDTRDRPPPFSHSTCSPPTVFDCPGRLNVALTRARKCLVICMHSGELKMPMWQALIQDAKNRNAFFTLSSVRDVHRKFRDLTRHKRSPS